MGGVGRGLEGKAGAKLPELVDNGSAGLPIQIHISAMLGMISPRVTGKLKRGKKENNTHPDF
jgi:hypothetical protein